jgi:hypothetical protein
MVAGLFCIYISQGRSGLIIVGISEITVMLVLIRRGVIGRALLLITVISAVSIFGTIAAFAVGGQSTIDRWSTLLESDPTSLYQRNRGQFLDQMLTTDLWKYPLGAGQGRWGMMHQYFGDQRRMIWAEMQWQALLYDGGIPLIIVYVAMLSSLLWTAFQVAKNTESNDLACWAAVVASYTFAAIVATFSFPFLCHDIGMHLMLLNACLYGVYKIESKGQPKKSLPIKKSYGTAFPARIPRLRPIAQ